MVKTIPGFIAKPESSGFARSCQRMHHDMTVDCVDPVSGSEWERLVESHPTAGFFHGSAWARVLAETYGHRPFYLRVSRDAETIAAIPAMEVRSFITGRRGVSLPFTDFCPMLVFRQNEMDSIIELMSELAQERGWRHIEFRGDSGMPPAARPSTSYYGHELDLRRTVDQLLAGFSGAVRRAIRKAESAGLEADVSTTLEAVEVFYGLHTQTRRKHGVPPQPWRFFRNLFQHVIAPGFGFVVLVKEGAKTVAASIFVRAGKKAVFKYGASDESALLTRGNNLAMWTAIRHLAATGAESLHFGRTSMGNEGLRRFKLGWGAAEETLCYFRYAPKSKQWLSGRDRSEGVHTAIFRKLPVALNRLAGAIIYPHLD